MLYLILNCACYLNHPHWCSILSKVWHISWYWCSNFRKNTPPLPPLCFQCHHRTDWMNGKFLYRPCSEFTMQKRYRLGIFRLPKEKKVRPQVMPSRALSPSRGQIDWLILQGLICPSWCVKYKITHVIIEKLKLTEILKCILRVTTKILLPFLFSLFKVVFSGLSIDLEKRPKSNYLKENYPTKENREIMMNVFFFLPLLHGKTSFFSLYWQNRIYLIKTKSYLIIKVLLKKHPQLTNTSFLWLTFNVRLTVIP